MRFLALARYRYLLSIRAPVATMNFSAAFGMTLFASAASWQYLTVPSGYFPRVAPEAFHAAATSFMVMGFVHSIVMGIVACSFGASLAKGMTRDLMESAPIRPLDQFFGDWIGILMAALTIHACLLPLLTTFYALGPLGPSALALRELFILGVLLFFSCTGVWALRAESLRWSVTRLLRAFSVAAIAAALLLWVSTRNWNDSLDATGEMMGAPTRNHWETFVNTLSFPAGAAGAAAAIYIGFMIYFFLASMKQPASQI